MGRKLPRAKIRDAEAVHRRRLQVAKRFYQAYYEWHALRTSGQIETDILVSPDGEEFYMPDLMTGYNFLPRRQRQSFELICLRSYTEAEATAVILPGSKWSTPVQQYAADALERMLSAYDARQTGTWDPVAVAATRKLGDMVTELSAAEAKLLAARAVPSGVSEKI